MKDHHDAEISGFFHDIPREPVAARCPTPRPRRRSEKNRRGRRRRRQRDSSAEKRGSFPPLHNGSTSMSCSSLSIEPHDQQPTNWADFKPEEQSHQQGNDPPVPPRRQSCPPPPSPPPRCRVFKDLKFIYFDFSRLIRNPSSV